MQVGRKPLHRHHLPIEYRALELRDPRGDLAERVDQRRHAIVGRADHPAPGFECPHLRHLQMLQRAD